jgi:hypothetical protein
MKNLEPQDRTGPYATGRERGYREIEEEEEIIVCPKCAGNGRIEKSIEVEPGVVILGLIVLAVFCFGLILGALAFWAFS